jgi:hypothetical protein
VYIARVRKERGNGGWLEVLVLWGFGFRVSGLGFRLCASAGVGRRAQNGDCARRGDFVWSEATRAHTHTCISILIMIKFFRVSSRMT